MLTISTIQEALAYLTEQTKHAWTDSELFDIAANSSIELHAATPIDSMVTIQHFVPGAGLVEKCRFGVTSPCLGVLFPWQVGQLWLCGETETSHPFDHDRVHGEYKWFVEPVSVTRSEVRIRAESLRKIQAIWMKKNDQIKPDAVAVTSGLDEGGSVEKPLKTTERASLLTIIAALCNYSDIKYQERGAAKQIAQLTEEIGAAVSDDTVRRALEKIHGALESRKK